ncbi:hypothetical protein CAOG_08106 [Capsaspora owczarzaki ATCC 30864]|uniref:Mitochondrial import receptor subunit tom22 n=1 Tax=Capsaspora owczarzaki (strain ATCC 30864) TaxID=595528 RepID=A0A0D2X5M7_CAPO3|nr:hypothetical protein CAOG_08106 [Capsaspora owczarzaki ATCC 30864]KJE98079.1 hypothetical protein CAOG_008106 [Capsaspora owczarzaki ATCC 30864]|eukprot:XP_004342707.1 hypothetical protein CAOG_08106 [Capsaspora owczarzaki ATCC 30864]
MSGIVELNEEGGEVIDLTAEEQAHGHSHSGPHAHSHSHSHSHSHGGDDDDEHDDDNDEDDEAAASASAANVAAFLANLAAELAEDQAAGRVDGAIEEVEDDDDDQYEDEDEDDSKQLATSDAAAAAAAEADDDAEIDNMDDSEFDYPESIGERLAGLKEIIPAGPRNAIYSAVTLSTWATKSLVRLSGKIAWVVGTSALITLVPLGLEVEAEQQFVMWEAEQQSTMMQQQQMLQPNVFDASQPVAAK